MKITLLKKYLPELVIIIFSFFLFSSRFSPAINSDDAISVLMTHDFEIPDAIYFWGQDRLGSIVVLLGQILYSWFEINSVWAESITHHIFLIIGYFFFATILKSKFSKVLMALVWFLPPLYFTSYVRISYGFLYSIIGIIIWLSNIYSERKDQKIIPRIAILSSIIFLSIVSIWVLDQAIIVLSIIALFYLLEKYRNLKSLKQTVVNLETAVIALGYVLAAAVILYLKSIAVTSSFDNYSDTLFNNIEQIIESIHIILISIFEVLTFKTPNFIFSIYAHLSILILAYSIFKLRKQKVLRVNKQYIILFITILSIILMTVILSNWAFNNGVARRYFSGIYFLSWLSFLLYIEQYKISKTLKSLILFTVLLGSISTVYNYKYIYPKRLTSKYKVVKEFEKLGKIGLIAEYWNSYGSSFCNPDLIKATPHDKSNIRNWDYVDSVLAQEKIYFIRDLWLDSFPKSINQFGINFTKVGNEFNIADCWVNKYKQEPINHIYLPSDMNIKENENQIKSCTFHNTSSEYFNTHIVFGPNINLPKRKYKVIFDIEINNITTKEVFAILDVSSNSGNHILAESQLSSETIINNEFQLNFECDRYENNIEFRIYYIGGADVIFNKVSLIEI